MEHRSIVVCINPDVLGDMMTGGCAFRCTAGLPSSGAKFVGAYVQEHLGTNRICICLTFEHPSFEAQAGNTAPVLAPVFERLPDA